MICYQCKAKFESPRKGIERKWCPVCGRDWRQPTLKHRIREAIEAFKCKPKVKHRVTMTVTGFSGDTTTDNYIQDKDAQTELTK